MKQHKLTTAQLRKLVEAIGDGSDFPKFTDDVRLVVHNDTIHWLYTEEIEAAARLLGRVRHGILGTTAAHA